MGTLFSTDVKDTPANDTPTPISRAESGSMKRTRSDKRTRKSATTDQGDLPQVNEVKNQGDVDKDLDESQFNLVASTSPGKNSNGELAASSPSSAPSAFVPMQGTKEATAILFKQFQEILKSNPEKEGYRIELANDNIYLWHIYLFNFPPECQIHDDLKMYVEARRDRPEAVLVEAIFPETYPTKPPFMRIVYPRFHQYTGHITIGGSICVKELTMSGWDPEFKLPQFVIMIRNLLMEGGALVDMSNPALDYSLREAQQAFTRVASQHGWKV